MVQKAKMRAGGRVVYTMNEGILIGNKEGGECI